MELTAETRLWALSYIASYADLIAAFGADAAAGLAHFEDFGEAEGRTVAFDWADYLAVNTDLITPTNAVPVEAVHHFILFGAEEGRETDGFDAFGYLASNTEVLRLVGTSPEDATEHYVTVGFEEGLGTTGFDAYGYLANYADLAETFGADIAAATEHFVMNGFREGRTDDGFDGLGYIAGYGDLIESFGVDAEAGTRHFVEFGRAEERSGELFHGFTYLASNPDLIDSVGPDADAAVRHFIETGYADGLARDGFDGEQYLANYADVRAVFGDSNEGAAEHFVRWGWAEGRTDVGLSLELAETASVDENEGPGEDALATASVTADERVTYEISAGNEAGRFAIDEATGAITLTEALDHEDVARYTLTVMAREALLPARTASREIVITVGDVNEGPTATGGQFSVAENAAAGTVIGTVTATDPDDGDAVTFSIVGGNGDSRFAIDAQSGEIRAVAPLDFETLTQYVLTVRGRDSGSPALSDEVQVTIDVTDVNEAPVSDDATFDIDEDAAIGAAIGTVSASDPEGEDSFDFSFVSGNADDVFVIDSSSGAITLAKPLDRETQATYDLQVRVAEAGTPSSQTIAEITIRVGNVNEAPVVEDATYAVSESAANGTRVGFVNATDPDENDVFRFAITNGNADGAFAIDADTGEVTVAGALDFETEAQRTLTVRVTDNGTPSLSDTATITVDIEDDVQERPQLAEQDFTLDENSGANAVIGTVVATTDTPNPDFRFEIASGNGAGLFAIDAETGELRATQSLDFEEQSSFTLTVRVIDDAAGGLSETGDTTIDVGDVNEAPSAEDRSFSVLDDRAVGFVLGTVPASDPDAGDTLTYRITDGNTGSAFAIDGDTGAIRLAKTLDAETQSSYTLTVEVEDGGSPGLTDTATVSIDVEDAGPPPPQDSPFIDVWYGNEQIFGTPGEAQRWVNILGDVDPSQISSLSYTLNDGPEQSLNFAADTRRLQRDGDFNIEIDFAQLDGTSTDDVVTIIATRNNGTKEIDTVTIDYVDGQTWSENYAVDWASIGDPQDNVQIIDGKWAYDSATDGFRPVELGYDRLLAIGDRSWDNYEVEMRVAITDLDNVDPRGRDGGAFAFGFNWKGHTDDPVPGFSPKAGWEPGTSLFYMDRGQGLGFRYASYDDFFDELAFENATLEEGQSYDFRIRVEETGFNEMSYFMKFWSVGDDEPDDWFLSATETIANSEHGGSFYMVAHYFDVTFGDIQVTELSDGFV